MSERPDPDSLVLLATYSDQAEAMTVRGLLAAEGIESISLNPDSVIDTWQRLAQG